MKHFSTVRLLLGVLVLLVLSPGCGAHRRLNAAALAPNPWFEITPEDYGLSPEVMSVETGDARIHTWIFHTSESKATVMVCNGNSGNKALYLPIVPHFLAVGYDVVLFDYRGFGLSTGTADLYKLVEDTAKVVDAVHARAPDRPLVLLGTSLGSAIATLVARDRATAIRALILESTFSPRELCRELTGKFAGTFACPALVPSELETSRQLKHVEQPVLMVHGSTDEMTPVESAARMYRDASAPGRVREFWLAAGAGHTPGLVGKYGPVYLQRITQFVDAALSPPASASPQASWTYAADRGVIDVRFSAEVLRSDTPTPVEIAIVYPSGETTTHRRWLEPDTDPVLTIPVIQNPLLVSAMAAQVKVERDGDGWIETDLVVTRRIEKMLQHLWEIVEGGPLDRLIYGQQRRLRSSQYVWEPYDPGTSERKAAGIARLLELVPETRLAAADATSDNDRAHAARALANLGAAFELLGSVDQAPALYEQAVARAPDHPERVVLYGDGSWSIGLGHTIGLVLHRLATLAKTPAERDSWLLRLGEHSQSMRERQTMLVRWRKEQEAK